MSDSIDRDQIHADANLSEIRRLWPQLAEALHPGTARRWSEHQDDEEQAARRDALARQERAERDMDAPGYTRAPAVIPVLSTLIAERFAMVELEDNVRDVLGFASLRGRDTVEACMWISSAVPALADHPDLLEHVRRETSRSLRAVKRAIGDSEQVQRIKAPCPICGSLSLRAFPERELVVCINGDCRCAHDECGCQDGRRHRWVYDEWPWLAGLLNADLAAAEEESA